MPSGIRHVPMRRCHRQSAHWNPNRRSVKGPAHDGGPKEILRVANLKPSPPRQDAAHIDLDGTRQFPVIYNNICAARARTGWAGRRSRCR